MIAIRSTCLLSSLLLLPLSLANSTLADDQQKSVNNLAVDSVDPAKVLALFQKYCIACHSDNDPEGDVIVSSLTKAVAGKSSGGKWITPGKPAESLIYQTVTGDLEPRMPPEEEPQPSKEEVQLLLRWIEQGAKTDVQDPVSTKKNLPKRQHHQLRIGSGQHR